VGLSRRTRKISLKVAANEADVDRVSFGAAHRQVRYTIDLMSPAELQLLRRAVVVHDEEDEVVVDFVLAELPG